MCATILKMMENGSKNWQLAIFIKLATTKIMMLTEFSKPNFGLTWLKIRRRTTVIINFAYYYSGYFVAAQC